MEPKSSLLREGRYVRSGIRTLMRLPKETTMSDCVRCGAPVPADRLVCRLCARDVFPAPVAAREPDNPSGFPVAATFPTPGSADEAGWRAIAIRALGVWARRCLQLGAPVTELAEVVRVEHELWSSDPFYTEQEPRVAIVRGTLVGDADALPTLDLAGELPNSEQKTEAGQ